VAFRVFGGLWHIGGMQNDPPDREPPDNWVGVGLPPDLYSPDDPPLVQLFAILLWYGITIPALLGLGWVIKWLIDWLVRTVG
jgi:hypothetical protein